MYAAMQSWPSTLSTGVLMDLCTHKQETNIRDGFYYIILFYFFRNFEHLIPDAPELIHDFLVNEKDASCKRNAFMMLIHADQVQSLLIVLQILFLSTRM